MYSKQIVFYLVLSCIGLGALAKKPIDQNNSTEVYHHHGNGTAQRQDLPIVNRGGPVMKTPVAYLIFYGTWAASDRAIMTTFVQNVGKSAWWGVSMGYGVGRLNYSGSFVDSAYSQGRIFNGTTVEDIVRYSLKKRHFPTTTNGIYIVIASSDVKNVVACGYHSPIAGNLKLAFIASTCPTDSPSPNGNPLVDGMINTIAHELAESVTDPNLNAWGDADGAEVGDKCQATYLGVKTLPNGAKYNIVVGNRKYLIASTWDLKTQSCQMS